MPYRLHLENHGKDLHEFTAPEFLADAHGARSGRAGERRQGDGGAARDGGRPVHLVPIKAGTFRLTCADHDWDGMVGEIEVE